MALSLFALASNATVTVFDNPFYSDVEVEHPLFVSIRPSPIAMASRDEVTTHLDHLE